MKTSKNEVISHLVGDDLTYNCETKISLRQIEWVCEYEPKRGHLWHGYTPFGCYTVYQTADQNWWILEGMHQDGEYPCGYLEDARNLAQADYASRLGEVLGVKVDKSRDRIPGSWDCGDDSEVL